MSKPEASTIAAAAPVAAPPPRKPLVGPAYREFISNVVSRKVARNYLEVGVHNGSTLALIDCPSIGVDPAFVFDRNPVGKKSVMHLYQMGSDQFFRDHDPRAIFGSAVDVVFLDGMHQFEYLLRDFMNAERVCDGNSLIMMDDCLPINVEMTERQHRPELRKDKPLAGWWTGDVWKVVTILREYRPDLRILPVDVTPTGSMVVTNLDPTSMVLKDAYLDIMDRFAAIEFEAKTFDAYWSLNRPCPAADLIANFELSRHIRV